MKKNLLILLVIGVLGSASLSSCQSIQKNIKVDVNDVPLIYRTY